MVTEQIILAIVHSLNGKACTTSLTLDGSGSDEPNNPKTSSNVYENALSKNNLYDELLLSFDVGEIQSAILWMMLRGYITTFGYGMIALEMGYQLTEKGQEFAKTKEMPEQDRRRLSGAALSIKPSIYGITLNPRELWWKIKKLFSKPAV